MEHLASRDGASARDSILFFAVAAVAIVGVLFAYQREAAPSLVFVIGVGSVFLYTGLAWWSSRFSGREDLVGDGAYYLGFLLTLVSLGHALWVFDAGAGAEPVIRGFGLALSTTIAGLSLRVVFQLLRKDPLEPDQDSRLALREATDELERQARGTVEDLSILRVRVSEELAQVAGGALEHMLVLQREEVQRTTQAFVTQMEATLKSVRETSEGLKEHVSSSKTQTSRLITAIGRLADRIDQSEVPTEPLRRQFKEMAAQMEEWLKFEKERTEEQRRASEQLLGTHKTMHASAIAAQQVMNRLMQSSEKLQSGVTELGRASDEAARVIRQVSSETVVAVQVQENVLQKMLKDAEDAGRQINDHRHLLGEAVSEGAAAVVQLNKQVVTAADTIVRELKK